MSPIQECPVSLWKLSPCPVEVALFKAITKVSVFICVGTHLAYGLSCHGEDSFSNRRGWQHARKMTGSDCLFHGRTIPSQEINWSFSHVFSLFLVPQFPREGGEKLELICWEEALVAGWKLMVGLEDMIKACLKWGSGLPCSHWFPSLWEQRTSELR